ncbi:MAG: helix-turn-helix domain-containing protein [Pseudomonadota bacterium]
MTQEADTNKTRKRAPQERAEVTKKLLLEAAIRQFSERGYDAVTLREIELDAGVQRNLLKYHFGSKENIWTLAAQSLINHQGIFLASRMDVIKDLSVHERVAFTIRSYVRFCSEHPEFHRLMAQEGKQASWRMNWLVDNHLLPAMKNLRETVEDDIGITDDEFVNWYYMYVASGAFIFAMAPEVERMFGVNPQDEQLIERHANMMVDFLLSRADK